MQNGNLTVGSMPGITGRLLNKAEYDSRFRARLLADPKAAIVGEFGVDIPEGHQIHVHETSKCVTHLVIPPPHPFTEDEREAARTGALSLEYLKKTMFDPAPPMRPPRARSETKTCEPRAAAELASAARGSIRRGLDFLETQIDENGAWHCIRYNIADENIPRHYERPPFVSAYCALALECCGEPKAKAICAATREYLAATMEFPGLWRYYSHLPQDLDSTTTCSLVIGNHPWIQFGGNIPRMLENRDDLGRFMTWILAPGEPDVTAKFRIEADPVVNANVIALLGDCQETRPVQSWLASLLNDGSILDSSKWYPDTVAVCYAISRAVRRVRPVLDHLGPKIADHVMASCDGSGDFANTIQTAQAVSSLYDVSELERIDKRRQTEILLAAQHDDGSWPELLAFGDQKLMWGSVGQIGHASESMTTAFCIEALERLAESIGR